MALYELLNLTFQFLDSFAFIVLATVGLAIIFGMMGIINLAHGEFILVGAYATTLSFNLLGVPLVLAMLVGIIATTVYGIILERLIIHRLYGRLLDSMVVTFGISLVMIQLTRIVFGNSLDQIGTPFGGISYGVYSYSAYRIMLAGAAILTLAALYVVFTRTTFGIKARATIQDEETARSMGVDTDRMYLSTFAIGSALAGLTGALYAPTITMSPDLGANFLVEAFVAVVVGGPSVLIGTSLAGGFLGTIDAIFTYVGGTFIGQVALLTAAIFAIRFLPDGITGLLEDIRAKRREAQ
ncbi:urea ABC transporter, permease protein UrtB [Salinadaptatus halalkaliphilus]|uniref:Urea ABC transporter, permease protein UrtB n=1 Tax=Salinadaptatus halalkaliphilus TaxID=2419781 RepID=A0A4S3TPN9_9EURY|nr:urea ABC transporter, permease protein UrtB [Salinadaptatus halalkaliphilus]THE66302.1 urea ABC transporter, permease protein UrtB [Salinadaptatus halalkaliphilus]